MLTRVRLPHEPARHRRLTAALAALALVSLGVLAAIVGHAATASATTVPPPPSGWTTTYSDSFSGSAGSGVDSGWTYDTGTQYNGTGCTANWGTGEVETNTSSTANVAEDGNGHLNVTAVDNGGSWTSGRIETVADDFEAPAGGEMEVSASIEQPDPSTGLGYWPAFWMLGAGFRSSGAGTSGTMDCSNWPSTGEIDVMEDVNALSEHSGTLHCGTDPGGPCDETTGLSSGLQACSGCQTGYNTYSVIVNRTNTSDESITWYLNGTAYYTVTESQVGTATWEAAVDRGFFLILDLSIGGAYPNGVCGCTSPTSSTASGGTMGVAYVAPYSTSGGGPTPPPTGTTGPVTGYEGLCMDVRGANSANFTPVQVYTCNGTNAQQWTVVQAGSTLHALGSCLDVDGAGTANGTTVDLYTCNGTGAQVWEPQSNGELYNPNSGKCLDDTGYGGSGTQLQIWACADTSNQQWPLP